ncbi:MAG: glycosyltransferase family protein [Pseudomonadota bacterium]
MLRRGANQVRILYGVVGEGMGHATRSRVVLEHLLRAGHEVRVVVSGRAHRFLTERLTGFSNVSILEIHGLTLSYFGNSLDRSKSLFENLRKAPKGIRKNVAVYQSVAESGFAPELVISDFESWAALYALNHRVPVVSIDNMQVINRCRHQREPTSGKGFDFDLARLAVKIKMPGAYHYLATSFFFPEVRKKYTTLVPPILRPEVIAAKREPGAHVLVYQTSPTNQSLVPTLKKLPYRFRVYGMGREGQEGNVTLCGFSETRFLDDLRTARAAVAGGGFSLLSEAVSLKVPLLSVPVAHQYEQELNARYLQQLGYGAWARKLELEPLQQFLERVDVYQDTLQGYPSRDNSILFACVDELIERVARGESRPARLTADAPGKFESD